MTETQGDTFKLADQRWTAQRRWAYGLSLGLILLGGVLNLGYLWNNCPLSLSGDECHYWEWSRHLDYGYYSKGPGIAWLMALTTFVGRLFGIVEPTAALIRTPAVILSLITGLTSLALARRIFKDNRAGLAVTVLSVTIPMFVVGALLLTIDAPMYCCWALATYSFWRFIGCGEGEGIKGRGFGWLYVVGFLVGLGILFKPVLIAWPLCAGIAAWVSPGIRRRLKTKHCWGALLVVLLMQMPIVIWNVNHNWVTFKHISTQGGLAVGAGEESKAHHWYDPLGRLGGYVGGQAGGMGGIMFVLLGLGVINTWRASRKARRTSNGPRMSSGAPPHSTPPPSLSLAPTPPMKIDTGENPILMGKRLLLSFTWPLWAFYAVLSLWTNVEANWPAASYFAGMVLLAGIVAEEWGSNKVLRVTVRIAVVWGIILASLAQHTEWFYPIAKEKLAKAADPLKSPWNLKRWDPTLRIRGKQEFAQAVELARRAMEAESGVGGVVVAGTRYDTSSGLAFYLPGQPFVYCLGSKLGQRQSQYDVWADKGLQLKAGQSVIVVGGIDQIYFEQVLRPAFEKIEPAEWNRGEPDPSIKVPFMYQGMRVQDIPVWRCYGFRGFPTLQNGPQSRY